MRKLHIARRKEIEQHGDPVRLHELAAITFIRAQSVGDLSQQVVGPPNLLTPQGLFDQLERFPLPGAQTRLGDSPTVFVFRDAKSRFDLSLDDHPTSADAGRNIFDPHLILSEISPRDVLNQLARLLDADVVSRGAQPDCAGDHRERAQSKEQGTPGLDSQFHRKSSAFFAPPFILRRAPGAMATGAARYSNEGANDGSRNGAPDKF